MELSSRWASCYVLQYVRVTELPSAQQRLLGLYSQSTLLHYYMFRSHKDHHQVVT
jgi:hypothetical protein